SFDDLADEPDPARIAELNRASTRQAVWFTIITVAISLIVAVGSVVIFRLVGGPECDAGTATWFCSSTRQIISVIVVSVTPILGLLCSAVMLIRTLRRSLRWRPLLGAFWLMVPHCMFWMTQTLLELSNVLNSLTHTFFAIRCIAPRVQLSCRLAMIRPDGVV